MPKDRGKQIIEHLKDYVLFDLETTGTSCVSDQVVEIAAIKVINGQITDEFATLVNPGCPIPYGASQVNGITDDMVKDAPEFRTVLSDFLKFVGDLPLVGHNIHTFDMRFICRDCMEFFGTFPANDYADTLTIARICLPDLRHHTLSDLANHFGISASGAHRALADCRMNQAVYEKLGELMRDHPELIKKCPRCGDILVKRYGKFGAFWGCSSYPDCKYTKNIE